MVKFAKFSALAAFAAVLTMFGIALSASAGHVEPTLLTGNVSCGNSIENPITKDYGTVNVTKNGSYFDFTTDEGYVVTDVFVKGGKNTNWYNYGTGTTGDTGLHAPINPNNGQPYGLSHVCFEVDVKTPPPPSTSTSTSTSPTPDPKP